MLTSPWHGWTRSLAGGQRRALSYGSSGDFRPGPVSSSTGGMRQLKGALAPAAPQTEPCWLSAEATWRHGERPADSWKREGGGRKMPWKPREQPSDAKPEQQSSYERGKTKVCKRNDGAAPQRENVRKRRNYLHAQRNISQHKLQLNKGFLKGQTIFMMNDYSSLNQAGSNRLNLC